MLKLITRIVLAWLAGGVLAFGVAAAQTSEVKAKVDVAKAEGVVGEMWDGYLGLVHGAAEPDVKLAVQEINWGRSKVYAQAADRNKVAVEVAGISAFKSIIEAKIQPGQFYRDDQGVWLKKPDPAATEPKK